MANSRTFLLTAVAATMAFLPTAAMAGPSAEKLLADGRVDDAIVSLRDSLTTSPNDAQSYNLLCRAYLALGNWDAGVTACQKAVALQPENGHYHLWLGRIYGEKADHSSFLSAAGLAKKVRSEFETAVRLNPRDLDARADLAEFYVEAPGIVGGGKDKAIAQAEEIGALDPAQGRLIRARIAEKEKNPTVAESEYRAAVQIGGGRPGLWMNLAQFYRRTGRLDEMQAALQHAISTDKNQYVLMPAAEALVRTKRDLPTAVRLLRRYLANGPVEDGPAFKAHYLLGTLLEGQGDRAAAAEQYRAALAMAKDFSPARKALDRLSQHVAENGAAQSSTRTSPI